MEYGELSALGVFFCSLCSMIAAVEKRYDKVSKLPKTVGCGF
jgi:hypothetical protein